VQASSLRGQDAHPTAAKFAPSSISLQLLVLGWIVPTSRRVAVCNKTNHIFHKSNKIFGLAVELGQNMRSKMFLGESRRGQASLSSCLTVESAVLRLPVKLGRTR